MSSQYEECCVCTDLLINKLSCGHAVHPSCIAKAGQNTCPVCRSPVEFDAEDQALYEHHARQLQFERVRSEQQASAELARQLTRQDRDQARQEYRSQISRARIRRAPVQVESEPDTEEISEDEEQQVREIPPPARLERQDDNTQSFVFGHRRFRIRVNEVDDGISEDNLALALNSLMYHVNNNDQNFEADSRAVQLYSAVLQLNAVSALSGLSVAQLTNVINLST
jgi:hypothetical protein